MRRLPLRLIIFFFFLLLTSGDINISVTDVPASDNLDPYGKPKHWLGKHWARQSAVGIFGILFNGLLLKIFLGAKETFTTSINTMIW